MINIQLDIEELHGVVEALCYAIDAREYEGKCTTDIIDRACINASANEWNVLRVKLLSFAKE